MKTYNFLQTEEECQKWLDSVCHASELIDFAEGAAETLKKKHLRYGGITDTLKDIEDLCEAFIYSFLNNPLLVEAEDDDPESYAYDEFFLGERATKWRDAFDALRQECLLYCVYGPGVEARTNEGHFSDDGIFPHGDVQMMRGEQESYWRGQLEHEQGFGKDDRIQGVHDIVAEQIKEAYNND
ncbi:MAG: hypothetical protein LUI09_06090 [Prevotellaceae bacterium]|nr:hypothetical protein [Prevotellaceae bacterium]